MRGIAAGEHTPEHTPDNVTGGEPCRGSQKGSRVAGAEQAFDNVVSGERIAVLCIGNILMQDDGLGPRLAADLQKGYQMPSNVSVLDRATMGMALIGELGSYDTILVVDAVDNTGYEPGTIVRFMPDDIAASSGFHGAHDARFADVLAAMALLGKTINGYCLGVQVANRQPDEYHIGLSASVEAAIPMLIDCVVEFLEEHGVKLTPGNN
jgi:hydrogenase maturation protease